jgi:hypothetical protein
VLSRQVVQTLLMLTLGACLRKKQSGNLAQLESEKVAFPFLTFESYVSQCTAGLGDIPDVNCAATEALPIFSYDPAEKTRPVAVKRIPAGSAVNSNTFCLNGAVGTPNAATSCATTTSLIVTESPNDVVWAALCRQDSVGLIGHSYKTGKTCFFEARSGYDEDSTYGLWKSKSGALPVFVPSPSRQVSTGNGFWLSPEQFSHPRYTETFRCVKCHSAGPFIRTPNALPNRVTSLLRFETAGQVWHDTPSNTKKGVPQARYEIIAQNGLNQLMGTRDWTPVSLDGLALKPCLTCHRNGPSLDSLRILDRDRKMVQAYPQFLANNKAVSVISILHKAADPHHLVGESIDERTGIFHLKDDFSYSKDMIIARALYHLQNCGKPGSEKECFAVQNNPVADPQSDDHIRFNFPFPLKNLQVSGLRNDLITRPSPLNKHELTCLRAQMKGSTFVRCLTRTEVLIQLKLFREGVESSPFGLGEIAFEGPLGSEIYSDRGSANKISSPEIYAQLAMKLEDGKYTTLQDWTTFSQNLGEGHQKLEICRRGENPCKPITVTFQVSH